MNDEKIFDLALDQSTASNGLFTVIERKPLSSLENNESLNLSNLSDPLGNSIDGVNKKAKDYTTQNTDKDNICEIYRLNTSQLLNDQLENAVSRISYVDDDVSSFYDSDKEDEFYFDNDISTLGSCYSVSSPSKISKGKKVRTSVAASVSKGYGGGRGSDEERTKYNPFFDPTFRNDSPVSVNQVGKKLHARAPSRYTQPYSRHGGRTRLASMDASNESLQNDHHDAEHDEDGDGDNNTDEEAQLGLQDHDDHMGNSQSSSHEKAIRVNKNVYRIVNIGQGGDDDKETVIRRIAQVRKTMLREKHAEGEADGGSPPHYDTTWSVSKLRDLRTGKGAFKEDREGNRTHNRFSEGIYLRKNENISRYNSDRRVKYVHANDQGGDIYMQLDRGDDNYEHTKEVEPSGNSQFKKKKKYLFLSKQPGQQGTAGDAQKYVTTDDQDEMSHHYLHGNGVYEKKQVRSSRPFADLPEDIARGEASFHESEPNVDMTGSTDGGMMDDHVEEDAFQSGGAVPQRSRYGEGHVQNVRKGGDSGEMRERRGKGDNVNRRAYRFHQYSGIAKGYHRVARVRRDTGYSADGNANLEADERYDIDEGVDDSNYSQLNKRVNRRMHHVNQQNRKEYIHENEHPPRSMHINGYDKTQNGMYSYEEESLEDPKQDELFTGEVYPARDMHTVGEGGATTYFRSAHSRGYKKVRGEDDQEKDGDEDRMYVHDGRMDQDTNYKKGMYRHGRYPVGVRGANQGRMDGRYHHDDRYHEEENSFNNYCDGRTSTNPHAYHRSEYLSGVNPSYRRQGSSENQISTYARGGNRKYEDGQSGDPHDGVDRHASYGTGHPAGVSRGANYPSDCYNSKRAHQRLSGHSNGVHHAGSHYHSAYNRIHPRGSYEGDEYYEEGTPSDQADYYDPRAMSYEQHEQHEVYEQLRTHDDQRNAFSKKTPPGSHSGAKPYFEEEGVNHKNEYLHNVPYHKTQLNRDDIHGHNNKADLHKESPPTMAADAHVLLNDKSTHILSDVKENATQVSEGGAQILPTVVDANVPHDNATTVSNAAVVGNALPPQIVMQLATQSTTQGVPPAVQENQPQAQPPVKRKRGRPRLKKTTTPSEEAPSNDSQSNVSTAQAVAVPTVQLNNQTGAPAAGQIANMSSEQNQPPTLYSNMGSAINPVYNNQMSNPNAHLQMTMEHPQSYQLGGPTLVLGQTLGQPVGQPVGQPLGQLLGQTQGHPLADPHNPMNQLNQMNPLSAQLAQQMGLPVGQHLNPQVGNHIGHQMGQHIGQQLSQMHTQMGQHMSQQMGQHMNHHNGYLLPSRTNNHFAPNINEDQYPAPYGSFEPDAPSHVGPNLCSRNFEQVRNNRDHMSYEEADNGEYHTNIRTTRSHASGSEDRHSEKDIKKVQKKRGRRRKNEVDQPDTHYKRSNSSSNQSNMNHAEAKSVDSYRNNSNEDSHSSSENRADQDYSTFVDENNKMVSYRVAYNPADTVWERLSGVKIGPLILTAQSRTTNVILAKNRSIQLGNINHNLIYGYIYKGDNVRLTIGKETRSVKTGSLFFLPSYNYCSIHNDDE
ncbi:hypothetical protein AK88_00678 [Plasmodium fragile]|uniref:Uncharacterized protein n=1 Tax=Plasmodium fragile TaxID=5857 RepID=A0A0D9QS17_PLAFR|nr:uncharacterized protein AK88_00678 [Plasmodium fragile]KJP89718.1 hypothetical protein AK88_00678 [Plasmodium fragile]